MVQNNYVFSLKIFIWTSLIFISLNVLDYGWYEYCTKENDN